MATGAALTFDEIDFERKLFEIKVEDSELNQYDEEHSLHVVERSKLSEEVEELEIRKKQLRNDDEDIKTINSKLAIAQIKWKVADSKRWKTNAQKSKRRYILRKEQLKEVCKAIDRSTKRDVLEKVNKVEEDIMYWEEQIKNWDGQIKLHEKALKQCKKKGVEVENSEEMSSWKEAWENQVYQIHKSRTSEQLDAVKPGVNDKSAKRMSADDVTLQNQKKELQGPKKRLSMPQFLKKEEAIGDANIIAMQFHSGVIPFKAVVTSLSEDDILGWHNLMISEREAMFRIKRAFDMTLSCHNRPMSYLEIRVSKAGDAGVFLEDVCVHVRENIEKKLAAICKKEAYSLAFFCTCSQTPAPHMMKVEISTALPPTQAVCDFTPLDQNLSEDQHLVWFAPSFKEFNFNKRGKLQLLTPVPNLQEKKKIRLISADIDKVIEVDYAQAIVKDRTLEGQPEETVIEQSNKFTNKSKSSVEHNWSYTASRSFGEENCHTTSKGWNVSGEFKPSIAIGGAGTSVGGISTSFGRQSEEKKSKFESKSNERKHEMKFSVPAKSTVIVKHLEISQNYKCTVENVGVTFNPRTKVKCKVQKVEDTKSLGREEEKQYELHELFCLDDQVIPNKNKVLQRSVSAIYEWKEAHNTIRVDKLSD